MTRQKSPSLKLARKGAKRQTKQPPPQLKKTAYHQDISLTPSTITMDELLELMEDNPHEEERPASSSSNNPTDEMDALLELMEENPPNDDEQDGTSSNRRGPRSASSSSSRLSSQRTTALVTPSSSDNSRRSSSSSGSNNAPKQKPIDVSVDDRLGIRMLNRTVSSIDLLDLISVNPYHSPATLSAMSLAALNRILLDPTAIVDKATVSGKTNVCTVGIVFSSTGTRISSKGSAFCCLTIGSFVSGPCVSVLLFGEAYTKHCRGAVPGKVVALVMPKLIPPRDNNNSSYKGSSSRGETTVSFSVHDNRQFLLVANARDYGICKATVRLKQADGTWTATGNCKKYIDKRKCEYCDAHRKQANNNAGSKTTTSSSNNQGGTFVQRMRNEFGQTNVPSANKNLVVREGSSTSVSSTSRFFNPSTANSKASLGGLGPKVPMQMKRTVPVGVRQSNTQSLTLANVNANVRNQKVGGNPLFQRQLDPKLKPKKQLGIVGASAGTTDDWLTKGTKRRTPLVAAATVANAQTNKKQRSVNTNGERFNGSVPVPKPSHLFSSRAPSLMARAATATLENTPPVENILQRQSEVARCLKEQTVVASNRLLKNTPTNHYSSTSSTTLSRGKATAPVKNTLEESLLGSMGKMDYEKIRNAKSKFANEADAEEYAKSRRVVVELEKLEASKEAKKKKDGKSNEENRFTKEWICVTCDAKFSTKPARCITGNHQVKLHRTLLKSTSKTDKRTEMHEKNVEDGGLSLGAGLEWSKWNRFG
jgi:minichromosome maintenance protein 10